MIHRKQYFNIPTEIARSVACIVELGSFTKAAERLGLTQSAVYAQVKRLQVLVGCPVFDRVAGGVELTERGKLLFPLICKMLDANDQILQQGGTAHEPRPLRVGLSTLYAERFLDDLAPGQLQNMNMLFENSEEIVRALSDGYVDVAAVLNPSETAGIIHARWGEPIVWVRSREFTLPSQNPVPLVGSPDLELNRLAINALEANGISYRLAFNSRDPSLRLKAARLGVGVLVLPSWLVPDDLIEAKEYYLPPIGDIQAGIISSTTTELENASECLESLKTLLPPAIAHATSALHRKIPLAASA